MGTPGDGWTVEEVEAVLARGDAGELVLIPLTVAMDPPDCDWSETVCVRLAGHADERVRASAVLGFGHLARTCGRLNAAVVRPIIKAALTDVSGHVRGQAEAAADDVSQFLGWRFAERAEAAKAVDGLDDTTEGSLGQLFQFVPRYGYGWHGEGGGPAEMPPAFRARLAWLWRYRGARRGGVARVETPGHRCDGMWLVFETRHEGTYNFATAPGDYNVTINSREPSRDIGDGSPWRHAGDASIVLEGWGQLTAEGSGETGGATVLKVKG